MTNVKKDKMKSDIKESPDTWNKLIANINLIHNIKTNDYDNASNDKEIFTISIHVYQINDNGNIDTNASDSWKLIVNYTKGEFEDKLPTYAKTITNVKNMLKLAEKKKVVSDMIGISYTEFIDAFDKLKSVPKPTAEEKAAISAAKKEATRLRNIEKKENEKRIKAEAKIKLAAHKKEAEANLEKMNAIRARKSEELDELKNDFNMFRRYANYLPEADKLASLTSREIETAQNNLANAEDYINNAVSSYKKYKKEGLVHKEDLDLLMEVYEVEQCVAKVKQVKEVLKK